MEKVCYLTNHTMLSIISWDTFSIDTIQNDMIEAQLLSWVCCSETVNAQLIDQFTHTEVVTLFKTLTIEWFIYQDQRRLSRTFIVTLPFVLLPISSYNVFWWHPQIWERVRFDGHTDFDERYKNITQFETRYRRYWIGINIEQVRHLRTRPNIPYIAKYPLM